MSITACIAEIRGLLPRRRAISMNPVRSRRDLSVARSKMGGSPDLSGLGYWPHCEACGSHMIFVMQIYRRDFPRFPFPPKASLFSIFRCPYPDCPNTSDAADRRLLMMYLAPGKWVSPYPPAVPSNYEQPISQCVFRPSLFWDRPSSLNWRSMSPQIMSLFRRLSTQLGENGALRVKRSITARQTIKIGGFPSWQQHFLTPVCPCGKPKEFVFQLSSGQPHGLMIGDAGNIYFFVCKACGPRTMESCWDCG